MHSRKKRGQLSIFFIVGVALLIVLILVLFMRSRDIDIVDAVVVPPEILPAKNYLDFCMDSASEDAFYILGRQGGFIEIPIEVQIDPSRRLSFGGGAETVPFWYYDNMNWIPTAEHMELELKRHINNGFLECINAMDFPANGFRMKTFEDNATTRVSINERDISVQIEYPVEISLADGSIKTKIKEFYSIYDIPLRDMLDLAKYILIYENTYYFLENLTMGMISINDEIPLTGMIPECGVRSWNIEDVEMELQALLMNTFSEIRVESTDYYPFKYNESLYRDYKEYGKALKEAYETVTLVDNLEEPGDYERALMAAASKVKKPTEPIPPDAYYYVHYYMPMKETDSERYSNFSVDFMYLPEFGMDMQAKPSEDGVLKSNSAEGFQKYLSFFCLNIYHFAYDITYPVVIVLNDPDALNDRGYSFRYAFPVLIRNNEGLRSKQYMDVYTTKSATDNFCQFDNDKQKATIRVYDTAAGSQNPIIGANISMYCVDKKCPLGVTKSYGGDAALIAGITTACGNPYIIAEKEGYFSGVHLLDEVRLDNPEINIEMVKLKNYTVNLKKHELDPTDNSTGPGKAVNDGTVSIYLSGYVNEKPFEDSFTIFAGAENNIQLPIADAEYDLSVTYMKNNVDFTGGYYATWDVTRAKLFSGNTITFHFVEVISSTLDEDLARSVSLLNELNSTQLIPDVK